MLNHMIPVPLLTVQIMKTSYCPVATWEVDAYFSTAAIMVHHIVALFLVSIIVIMLVSSQLLSDEQGTQVMIIAFI